MATTGSGWLPPEPAVPSLEGMRWWEPAGVAEQLVSDGRWNELSYIVLDELHEGVAGLVVGRWPRVDDRGRLHFGEEDEFTRIATSARALHALLDDERLPIVSVTVDAAAEGALRTRDLAIGDVFGARSGRAPGEPGGGGPGGEPLEDPRAVLGNRIVDITAEARQAAKLQATAAASGVMDEALIIAIAGEIAEDDGPQDRPEPEAEA